MTLLITLCLTLFALSETLTFTSTSGDTYVTLDSSASGTIANLSFYAENLATITQNKIVFKFHSRQPPWQLVGSAPDINISNYNGTYFSGDYSINVSVSTSLRANYTLKGYYVPFTKFNSTDTPTIVIGGTSTIYLDRTKLTTPSIAVSVSSSTKEDTATNNNLYINMNTTYTSSTYYIQFILSDACQNKINTNVFTAVKINDVEIGDTSFINYYYKVSCGSLTARANPTYFFEFTLQNPTCVGGLKIPFYITDSTYIYQYIELSTSLPSSPKSFTPTLSFGTSTFYTYDSNKLTVTFNPSLLYNEIINSITSNYKIEIKFPSSIGSGATKTDVITWSNGDTSLTYSDDTTRSFAASETDIGNFTINLYETSSSALCFSAEISNNDWKIVASPIIEATSSFTMSTKYPGILANYTFIMNRNKGIPISTLSIKLINGSDTSIYSVSITTSSSNSITFMMENIQNPLVAGQYYFQIKTYSGSATTISETGYINSTTTPVECNYACVECLVSNKSSCTKCSSQINNKQFLYLNNNTCQVDDCSVKNEGFYLSNTNECSACSILHCLKCSSISICTECETGYNIKDQNSCVSGCGDGFYADSNKICQKCNANCSTCTSDTICLNCTSLYFLRDDESCGNCTGIQYYTKTESTINKCLSCEQTSPSYCQSCVSSSSKCLSCINSSHYYNADLYKCLEKCNDGTYQYDFDHTCLNCSKECATCENASTTCILCSSGYIFKEDESKCTIDCGTNYYTLLVSGIKKCYICGSGCKTCNATYCLSCLDTVPYLMEDGKCNTTCDDPSYYTTSLSSINRCYVCSPTCATCQNSSYDCLSCPEGKKLFNKRCFDNCSKGYYNDNNECKTCDLSCAECTSLLNCSVCNKTNGTPFMQAELCKSKCTTPMYFQQSENTCVLCDPYCNGCSINSTYCTSCINDYFFSENHTCINVCGAGKYLYNDSYSNLWCGSCDKNKCFECINDSATCYSCNANKSLYLNTCYDTCPAGTYQQGTNCKVCYDKCKTCSDFYTCTSCLGNIKLENASCSSDTCSSLYYYDLSKKECLPCISPCYTCYNITFCFTCESGYLLFETTKTCTPSLPSHYYSEIIGQVTYAKQCNAVCSECFRVSTNCTECYSSYYFYLNSCLKQCPSTTFIYGDLMCVNCSKNCKTCDGSADYCLTCNFGLYLDGSECKSTCGEGKYYLDSKCKLCLASCKNCIDGDVKCTECRSGEYLYTDSNTCKNNTLVGYYFEDVIVNKTVAYRVANLCPKECKSCTSKVACQSCASDTFYYKESCVTKCDINTYISGQSCLDCDSICATCVNSSTTCTSCPIQTFLVNKTTCRDTCPAHYIPINDECQSCNNSCKECTSSKDNCDSCYDGVYKLGTTCVSTIPDGMYNDNGYLKSCLTLCIKCTTGINCFSCENGSYLINESQCNKTCPTGTVPNPERTGCVQCNDGYLYVLGECKACISPCINCINRTDLCTSCINNYVLKNGACTIIPTNNTNNNTNNDTNKNDTNNNTQNNTNTSVSSSQTVPVPFTLVSLLFVLITYFIQIKNQLARFTSNALAILGIILFPALGIQFYISMGIKNTIVFFGSAIFGLGVYVLINLIGTNVIIHSKLNKDDNYLTWKSGHKHAPKVITGFSSIFTFNLMRFLYSRPLGFNTLFVEFKDFHVLFIPLNMLSIAAIFTYHIELIGLEIYAMILLKAWNQKFVAFLDCLVIQLIMIILMMYEIKSLRSSRPSDLFEELNTNRYSKLNPVNDESFINISMMSKSLSQIRTRRKGKNAQRERSKSIDNLKVKQKSEKLLERRNSDPPSKAKKRTINNEMQKELKKVKLPSREPYFDNIYIESRDKKPIDLLIPKTDCTIQTASLHSVAMKTYLNKIIAPQLEVIPEEEKEHNNNQSDPEDKNRELNGIPLEEEKEHNNNQSDPEDKSKELNGILVLNDSRAPFGDKVASSFDSMSRDMPQTLVEYQIDQPPAALTRADYKKKKLKKIEDNLLGDEESDVIGKEEPHVNINDEIKKNTVPIPNTVNDDNNISGKKAKDTNQDKISESPLLDKEETPLTNGDKVHDGDFMIEDQNPLSNLNNKADDKENEKDLYTDKDENNPLTGLNSKKGTAKQSQEKNDAMPEDDYEFTEEKIKGESNANNEIDTKNIEQEKEDDDEERLERDKIIGEFDTDENDNIVIKQDDNGNLIDNNGRRVNKHGYLIDNDGNILDKDGNIVIKNNEIAYSDDESQIMNLVHERLNTKTVTPSNVVSEIAPKKLPAKPKEEDLENSIKGLINQLDSNANHGPFQRKKSEELDTRMDDTPSNYDFINQGLYSAELLREKLKPKVPEKGIRPNDELNLENTGEMDTQKLFHNHRAKKKKKLHSKNKSNLGIEISSQAPVDKEESFSTIQHSEFPVANNWNVQISSRSGEKPQIKKRSFKKEETVGEVKANENTLKILPPLKDDEDGESLGSQAVGMKPYKMPPNIGNLSTNSNPKMKSLENIYLQRLEATKNRKKKKSLKKRESSVMSRQSSEQDQLGIEMKRNYEIMRHNFANGSQSPDRIWKEDV